MRYRKTADGLLEVSALGFGTYAVSGVYGEKDPGSMRGLVRAAYDRGVTFFDTAPGYGEAEALLGEALAGVRGQVVISTKVPACLGGVSCSYDTITSGCAASLDNLKSDYIDLYQIHFDDGKTPVEEVVRAFDDLKAQGKIRTYGIGHVSPERAAEYLAKGSPSSVMGELNAVSRGYYLRMQPVLEEKAAGYIGFSLTGRGMLTETSVERSTLSSRDIRQMDAVFAGERRRSALRVRDEFGTVGRELGASAVQTAIAWALSLQHVVAGLVGPSSIKHLEEDIKAADLELGPSVRERLDSFLGQETSRLAANLTQEVVSVLGTEITHVEDGASSLIYAMEGLEELGLATEEDLVTKIGSVIKLMKGGKGGVAALEAIRRDLLDYVKAT